MDFFYSESCIYALGKYLENIVEGIKLNHSCLWCSKCPHKFGDFFIVRVFFRKYLKEKCCSEPNPQLSFKYVVTLTCLFSKVARGQMISLWESSRQFIRTPLTTIHQRVSAFVSFLEISNDQMKVFKGIPSIIGVIITNYCLPAEHWKS